MFVSAAIQRGASHRIIESWLGGSAEFEVVMCPELLDAIISGDKDLLEWEEQRPPVMTPAQFEDLDRTA